MSAEQLSAIELEHRLAAVERERDSLAKKVSELTDKLAYYDRWLTGGVYYTNDEYKKLWAEIREQQAKAEKERDAFKDMFQTSAQNYNVVKEQNAALRSLCAELVDELHVHDCPKNFSICRICTKLRKAQEVMGKK